MKAIRASILVLLGAALLSAAGYDQPVSAGGSSCTGWRSRSEEPRYIRVLNSRTGVVYKVAFKRYVAQVMATGEWPSYLPKAVLYAGAQATKQFAWYYTLKGHWRGGKSNGRCYDVTNTTNDQLWSARVKPTKKQLQAVNAVWGLSLWKRDQRFFMTGYRAGSSRACARDADGWRLYARSAVACARKGWSGERILKVYFTKTTQRWAAS